MKAIETKKPRIAFLPVVMKLFWQLYPELQKSMHDQLRVVLANAGVQCEVIEFPVAGSTDEAQEVIELMKKDSFDLIAVWEHGYVASAIPFRIIREFAGMPVILFITQRDREIPEDMDYARYMESTSITSAMELGGVLSRMGHRYHAVTGHMDDPGIYERLYSLAVSAHTAAEISRAKVGSIGYGYPGMLDICVDDAEVSKLVDQVCKITLDEMKDAMSGTDSAKTEAFRQDAAALFDMTRIKDDDFERAAKTYFALEQMVLKYGLSALCVHDYDFLSTVTGAVSDFALSMLERNHGLATGVEGDMPNTISALIGRKLSGRSCMFVDWTMTASSMNAIFLQHNGKADPDIVVDPVLSPSAEPFGGVIGEGVVVEAAGAEGDVTLTGMFYRNGWKIFAVDGEALRMKARPCRLNQITVKIIRPDMQIKTFIEKACEKGIGHHLNVVRGHWSREIRQTADFLNIEFIDINDNKKKCEEY